MILLMAVMLLVAAGCGSKSGVISEETYSQIQNGMSIDEVAKVAGQPQRTHHPGTSQATLDYWYYGKTEGEGLVRVAFDNGKVTNISPWNTDAGAAE
jgi:hypothetical protein